MTFVSGPSLSEARALAWWGACALVVATRAHPALPVNSIVFLEFDLFAVHESSAGVYGERWRILQAVQVISGPSYRLGALTSKSQVHATSTTPAVLGGSTAISVDVSGADVRLLVQSGDGLGTAKCWARVRINPSTG